MKLSPIAVIVVLLVAGEALQASPQPILVSPKPIEVDRQFPMQTFVQDLQVFLGLNIYPVENFDALEFNSFLLFDEQGKELARSNLKEEKVIKFASATGLFNLKPVTHKDTAILPMNSEVGRYKITQMNGEFSIAKQSTDRYYEVAGPRLMHDVLIKPDSSLVFIITTNDKHDIQADYDAQMAANSSPDGSTTVVDDGSNLQPEPPKDEETGGVRRMLQVEVLKTSGELVQVEASPPNIFMYDLSRWGQSQVSGAVDVRSYFDGGDQKGSEAERFYRGAYQMIASASRSDVLVFCGSPIRGDTDLILFSMHDLSTLKEIGRFKLSTANSFSPPSKSVVRPTKIFPDPTDPDVYFVITDATIFTAKKGADGFSLIGGVKAIEPYPITIDGRETTNVQMFEGLLFLPNTDFVVVLASNYPGFLVGDTQTEVVQSTMDGERRLAEKSSLLPFISIYRLSQLKNGEFLKTTEGYRISDEQYQIQTFGLFSCCKLLDGETYFGATEVPIEKTISKISIYKFTNLRDCSVAQCEECASDPAICTRCKAGLKLFSASLCAVPLTFSLADHPINRSPAVQSLVVEIEDFASLSLSSCQLLLLENKYLPEWALVTLIRKNRDIDFLCKTEVSVQ